MALRPVDLGVATISADSLERQIDAEIRQGFVSDGGFTFFMCTAEVKEADIVEIVNRYQAAGWNVKRQRRDHQDALLSGTLLVFSVPRT